jgi:hypothetical protein
MHVTVSAAMHEPVGSQVKALPAAASVRVRQHTLPEAQFGQVPAPPSVGVVPLLELLFDPLLDPLLLDPLLELLFDPLLELLLELVDESGVLLELSSLLQATMVLPTPSATKKSPRMIFMAGTVATLVAAAESPSRRDWPYRLAIGPLRGARTARLEEGQ